MTYALTAVELLLDLWPRNRSAWGEKAEAGHPAPEAPAFRRHLLSRAFQHLRSRLATSPYEPIEPDIIDHPAFQGMSARELADLPFPRYSVTDAAEAAEGQASALHPSST